MTKNPDSIVYEAVATSTGGRAGMAFSEAPEMQMEMRAPREMGGDGHGTNPEQLFALGYSACFNGALALAGKERGVAVDGSQVRTTVGLGPEGDSFALRVDIKVFIPGVDADDAQQLADRTHELCPYSKAIAGNVPVSVTAVDVL